MKAFIHCASTFIYDDVLTTSVENIQKQQKVNADAFIQAAVSYTQADLFSEKTRFIILIDAKVRKLNADHFSYTLSKLYLDSCIEFLAMSCASKMTVNAISPGLTLKSGEQTQEDFDYAQSLMPLGKLNVHHIIKTIDFIMRNDMMTGQNIVVDAGYHVMSQKDIVFWKKEF